MAPFLRSIRIGAGCALVAAASWACGGGSSGESQVGGAAGAGGQGGGTTTTMPEYRGSVSGRVLDDTGAAIPELGVSLCFSVCRVVETDASGAFVFEGIEPAVQVIENIGWPGNDPAAAALVHTKFFDFVTVGLDETVVIERPFVMRKLATQGSLSGPQQLTLDGGLQVSFDADRFGTATNPLPSPAMELRFGAVEIPPADYPVGGHDGWKILRAWGMAVWDLEHADGFTVSAPLGAAGPLPAVSEVAFLVADYTYGFVNGVFFEEAAELSPDGMTLSTTANGGLDRSTMWLAVVRDAP